MLNKELQVEIEVLHRQGKGIREIARETGIARNTVRAILRGEHRVVTAHANRVRQNWTRTKRICTIALSEPARLNYMQRCSCARSAR